MKDILTRIKDYFSKKTPISAPHFNPLSPTSEAENIDHYIKALNWALENSSRIKNIAVTGPYGSGKSSLLQSFQKKIENKKFHFLNISLATFKEDNAQLKNPLPSNYTDSNSDLLRLIELSILQQLFYHEKESVIPDSRFKKIKPLYWWEAVLTTLAILIFTICSYHLYNPDFFIEFFGILTSDHWLYSFKYPSLGVVLMLGALFIYKSIRVLKKISLKTLNINTTSIEIDSTISKSILNSHLDEILYFFEVTEYNVVIIEDLDRFEETEVFTKLREINFLINSSKKIDRDIVFIYAVKDDMFKDNDRTKFFDFMIPVIPIINTSNSNEKLLKIVTDNKYPISTELIEDISLFIDDMRLLYNIMNEYYIYSKNLNSNLSQNNLLAIIVYKNIYPNDFTEISTQESLLYDIFRKKNAYIQNEIDDANKKISELKSEIKKLKERHINNIEELRHIYVLKIIQEIILNSSPTYSTGFHRFSYNNISYTIDDVIKNKNNIFQELTGDKIKNFYYNTSNNTVPCVYKFKDIEEKINPEFTYLEREQQINDLKDSAIEELEEEIEVLEENKKEVRHFKIKDFILQKKIEIKLSNSKQKDLITILLQNGYIDENYLDYISIFYEGSLTKADHQFLINVKTQKSSPYDSKLFKIEKLIEKINTAEFSKKHILNYDLLNFLLSNEKHHEKRTLLISQLKGEFEEFIDGYINCSTFLDLFIKLLCEQWWNIWSFIEKKSSYSSDKREKYFKLIVDHADVKDIKYVFKSSYIASKTKFLTIGSDQAKIKEIIKELNVKFIGIDASSPANLLDFLYENNYYEINISMLKIILEHKSVYDENFFSAKNYDFISSSKLDKLINYVNSNIDKYVGSVYLTLESNKQDSSNSIIDLLNNLKVSVSNKEQIIGRMETKIEDISNIEDLSIALCLLTYNKVLPLWENIIYIYTWNDSLVSDEIISFINIVENAKELSAETIVSTEEERFLLDILMNNDIVDDIYTILLDAVDIDNIPPSFNFAELSSPKVKSLITKSIISISPENVKILKSKFSPLHILLLETDISVLLKTTSTIVLDNNDLLELLKSTSISITEKEKIIAAYKVDNLLSHSKIIIQIKKLLLVEDKFNVNDIILKSILTDKNILTEERLEIFTKKHNLINNEEVSDFLNSLDKPYNEIATKSFSSKIDNNSLNLQLVKILQEKKYISSYREDNGLVFNKIKINHFKK